MKLKLLTINTAGMQSEKNQFWSFLREASRWRAESQVQGFLIQEHNLHPAREPDLHRQALSQNFTLTIAFAPPGADGTHWGGTLILTDNKTTTRKQILDQQPHITRITVEWGAAVVEIASVYLPIDVFSMMQDLSAPFLLV